MKKIKHIFNLLFNPNYITPEEKVNKVKYLRQFKKKYNEMDIYEKMMSMSLYSIECCHSDILRNLGGLEANLISLNVISVGEPLPYNGGVELYKSCIIRLTKEYLTKTGCYEENKTN